MQVLLIEPNHILGSQYAAYLRRHGHEVVRVRSAQEAIEQTDRKTPDVIVLELVLTSHSGVEFLYEFRSYPEWRQVPVIVMSRLPQEDVFSSSDSMKQLGITDYLYKPNTTLKRLAARVAALAPAKA